MTMPTQRRGVVYDSVTRNEEADEHVVVTARPRRRSCVQPLVESTEIEDGRPSHGHVRAGADRTHRQGIVVVNVEGAPAESAGERTVFLEELLGGRFELQRKGESGHTRDLVIAEVRQQRSEPL